MAKPKLAVGLLLLLCLVISAPSPALAAPDEARWSKVNIPTEGRAGNWGLAKGSDVACLARAIDGTIYAYVKGLTYTLYQSSDGGRSWSYSSGFTGAIVDIACSRLNASIIYMTDGSHVYKSSDAAASFSPVADATLPALDANESITCLDVGYDAGGHPCLFIATADSDGGDFGGIYRLTEAVPGASWTDLGAGSYDVYSVAGSPEFRSDTQVIAIATDETRTYAINNYGVIGAWTGGVELLKDNLTPFAVTAASDIGFPADFAGTYRLFIGVAGGGGDVYRVTAGGAADLGVNADIISLGVAGGAGNAKLLAGAAGSARTYLSNNGGTTWLESTKPPTGDSETFVLMAADFNSLGQAYAATSGIESAFSYTTDGGLSWNQLGLIDTEISNIVDLAPSPNYRQDNTLFMLTLGTKHSLWRSSNSRPAWERVFTSTLAGVDSIDMVRVSPRYGNTSKVVFLAGVSGGDPAIWQSNDNGQTFSPPRITTDPTTGTPFNIEVWAVADDNTLFVGSFDAISSLGVAYRTTDGGLTYSTPAVLGNHPLNSMALSPGYAQDKTLIIGSTQGWVYRSNDNGTSFEPLPAGASLPPLTGNISVAFATSFSSNHTVYAASDAPDSDIYRFVIDQSTSWQGIDTTLPRGGLNPSQLGQPLVSAGGTLYATNSQPVNNANKEGGLERCLDPRDPAGPTFETVSGGLDDGATLAGLWLSGNKLWSVDTANTRLMAFTDSLAVPVVLILPLDQASAVDIRGIYLEWRQASGATRYEWQLDYNTDFSGAPLDDETQASSVWLPEQLKLATTYYWRVRVIEPQLSPWSATRSFTTRLGAGVTAPSLRSPGAGAKTVEIKPIFLWSAIAGADSYELLVASDAAFASPVIVRTGDQALPATAWQSDISLDYNTTYYWKVRAKSQTNYSEWSDVSAFSTRSSESTANPSSEPPPLLSLPQLITPELRSPGDAASGVPLKPIFQWGATAGANGYELLVASDAAFTSPVIIRVGAYALPATAWQSDISLEDNTTYYWKVRANNTDGYSEWSDVSAFTTRSPEPDANPSSEPSSSAETGIPGWAGYLALGLLLALVAILITLVILTVKVLRL